MKKIAFYVNNLDKGGSQRVILNLTESLLSKGYEALLITAYQGKDEYGLPQGAGRVYTEISPEEEGGSRAGNFLRRLRKLRSVFRQQKPDIVLSFIGKNNLMAILSAAGLGIPVLACVRGEPGEEYYSGLLRLLARFLFPGAAGVILQTEDSRAFFSERINRKAVVLPNPLHPDFVGERFTGEREKRIVMVGRLDANKNQRLVIDAFIPLAARYPDYVLEIWGRGGEDELARLRRYVDEKGMGERILLPGQTAQVRDKLFKAAVYVLSSNTEGMPNSLMEAMALGLAVISTDCPCGGPKTLIRHGENGLLAPVGEVKAMEEALDSLLGDPAYRERLGREAHRISGDLSPEKVSRQWEEYILSRCRGRAEENKDVRNCRLL